MTTAAEQPDFEPVKIEDWTLFAGKGDYWVYDLDLAARCEMAKGRDIRPVILSLIADGIVGVVGPAADQARGQVTKRSSSTAKRWGRVRKSAKTPLAADAVCDGATVYAEIQVLSTTVGKVKRPVLTFRLNELAALMVINRLRTPKAVRLQRAVARIFLAVAKGEYIGPRVEQLYQEIGELQLRVANDRLEIDVLRAKIDLLDTTSDGLAGSARATMIKGQINHVARILAKLEGDPDSAPARMKEIDNDLRQHVGFVAAAGQGWERLAVQQFPLVMQRLATLVTRANKLDTRTATAKEKGVEQLTLDRTAARRLGLVKMRKV